MSRVKPIAGQMSLLPDVPPVQYCRACGRSLRSEASRERGLGRLCARRIDQGQKRHLYCGSCLRLLGDSDCCDSCGMGYEFFPVRHRTHWVDAGAKPPKRLKSKGRD